MAFTNKFKMTVATGAAVILAGGLLANQAIQSKQISILEQEVSTQPVPTKVVVTPTATPSATLTPTTTYRVRAFLTPEAAVTGVKK